ncbi:MAG: KEOPS complex N(6)-L-threonylcarbamoyladenine synthase Kae1 [Candidatus Bathyarchaeia archaeon]
MYCLGIESTAHTFGAAVVSSEKRILSDVRDTYKPPSGKGIHPRESAQHHSEVAADVVRDALAASKLSMDEVDAVAYSKGPGLGPCLRTGATVARVLAAYYNKPLVPVNHAIGHIEIGMLTTGATHPLVLLVSGGHTCITALAGEMWRIFGETEDITVGNLLDVFAREARLGSPGGPIVEQLARKSSHFVELPYTVKGNDVSFSGLLTAASARLKEKRWSVESLCFSLQEVAFAMLAEATERALAFTEEDEVLLTGGVAANETLQQMIGYIAKEHGSAFCVVPKQFASDCGVQIAWTGLLAYQSGLIIPIQRSFVKPKWRMDEVKVPWRSRVGSVRK